MGESFPKPPEELEQEWKEWHPSRLACDATMLVVAPRNQGKTTFILDCAHKGNLRRGLIVCPTSEIFKTYAEHFPMLFCHERFDDKFEAQLRYIQQYHKGKEVSITARYKEMQNENESNATADELALWERTLRDLEDHAHRRGWSQGKFDQKRLALEQRHLKQNELRAIKRFEHYERCKKEWREYDSWLCIFDDLAYDKMAMKSQTIAKAVKNGRHYIMKQFYAAQSVRDFKCDNRDQIDVLAFSPNITVSNMKRFMEDFIPSGIKNPKEFAQILITFQKYGWWCVVERRTKSPDPHDFMFRYRAQWHPMAKTQIGCPEFKWVHQILFDPRKAAMDCMDMEGEDDVTQDFAGRPLSGAVRQKRLEAKQNRIDEQTRMFASIGPMSECAGIRRVVEEKIQYRKELERENRFKTERRPSEHSNSDSFRVDDSSPYKPHDKNHNHRQRDSHERRDHERSGQRHRRSDHSKRSSHSRRSIKRVSNESSYSRLRNRERPTSSSYGSDRMSYRNGPTSSHDRMPYQPYDPYLSNRYRPERVHEYHSEPVQHAYNPDDYMRHSSPPSYNVWSTPAMNEWPTHPSPSPVSYESWSMQQPNPSYNDSNHSMYNDTNNPYDYPVSVPTAMPPNQYDYSTWIQ